MDDTFTATLINGTKVPGCYSLKDNIDLYHIVHVPNHSSMFIPHEVVLAWKGTPKYSVKLDNGDTVIGCRRMLRGDRCNVPYFVLLKDDGWYDECKFFNFVISHTTIGELVRAIKDLQDPVYRIPGNPLGMELAKLDRWTPKFHRDFSKTTRIVIQVLCILEDFGLLLYTNY